MASFYVIVPVAVFSIGVVVILMIAYRKGKETGDRKSKKLKSRDRGAIVREANRRLSQNPKDADALRALADLYYQEEDFAKSAKTYGLLIDLCATNKEINEFEVTVRYGISALRLGRQALPHTSARDLGGLDEHFFGSDVSLEPFAILSRGQLQRTGGSAARMEQTEPQFPGESGGAAAASVGVRSSLGASFHRSSSR